MNNRDFRPRQQSQSQSPNSNPNFKNAIKNSVRRKVDRKPKNMRRPMHKFNPKQQEVPPIGDNIRIIPLGGVEEVGKNMTAIEIGNDIIIIDAGFQFKDETTPGIDYIIPNTKYLEERKDKIRAMFITHGHLDHIGGLPYIIEKIGNPTIYSRKFGAIMIKKRHEEFPHLPPLNIVILDGDETIPISPNIKVESFAISHTIPDSMGLVIHTHMGDIVFIEDVRVDNMKGIPTDEEVHQYKRFANKEALLLTMDSTSVEKPGWSLSENVVVEKIDRIIKETHGRLIIGTFASQVERILAIINAAEKYGKKLVIEGRSMKSNVDIIKYLKLTEVEGVIIPITDMQNYPPDRIILLVTGAQGEEFAALMRMASKSHKYVTLRKEDTILLSSSIIPVNHSSVIRLKDKLYRSDARIITYLDSDVHASGHGNREELKWIHEQIKYKFFIPLHGHHYMLKQHADLSMSIGTPKENVIVPDNGSIIEISDNGNKIEVLPMKAPNEVVTVDGFSISDLQEVVIRDRQLLSEAGIFMIVASINTKTGRLKKSPDIISRGFVYLRESQDLLQEARNIIKRLIEKNIQGKSQIDFEYLKKIVADEISKYLFQQTAKEPLVIPVILGV
jgi:ribonuclease J